MTKCMLFMEQPISIVLLDRFLSITLNRIVEGKFINLFKIVNIEVELQL